MHKACDNEPFRLDYPRQVKLYHVHICNEKSVLIANVPVELKSNFWDDITNQKFDSKSKFNFIDEKLP